MTAEWILTSTVLILCVLLVRAVLGRRMGPKLRYGLWLLVLLRLLIPFSFGQSAASPANLVRIQEDTLFVTPIVTGQPQDVGVTVKPDGTVLDPNSMGYTAVNGPGGTVTRYVSTFDLKEVLLDLLPKLWMVGMAAAFSWFLFCNLLFYRHLRRSRKLLQTDGALRIYEADAPSPCLFGLFRPAIYVTAAAARDEWMLEHTLLHEKTHLRHGDHIWALLRTVCLILWWYHPLVWLAARLSRQDSELYCDAAVIAQLGEEHRADYGRTLLTLAAKCRTATSFCAASTLSRGGRQLKSRITAIARWARPKKWAIVLALLLAALAVGCAFTGAAQPSEAPADVETDAADTPTSESPAVESLRTPGPLTDADLKSGEEIHLGMSFDQVDALLSFTEEEFLGNAMGMQSYQRDDTLYTFYRDDSGWKFWLMGLSTQTEENFLGLGVGVGSTLNEVVTLLGCNPADDPGTAQTWQLYGAEGELNSAQVTSGETDGDRFLSVWTENGNLLFQLRQDVVIQADVSLFNTASWHPVSDVDLVSAHGLTLGMAYDEAMDLLEFTDSVTETPRNTQVEKDGILYLFQEIDPADSAGFQLAMYSTDVPGTALPLGLKVGDSVAPFLRSYAGLVDLPELPLSENVYLYGTQESAQSMLLTTPYVDDSVGDLQIRTEQGLFRCRLDEDYRITFADCTYQAPMDVLPLFRTDPAYQDATVLDWLESDDEYLRGAVLYTMPGDASLWVAYCIPSYPSYFYPVGIGDPDSPSPLEYQEDTFRYEGDGTVAFSFYEPSIGQVVDYTISYSSDENGNVQFTADSSPMPQ